MLIDHQRFLLENVSMTVSHLYNSRLETARPLFEPDK